MSEFNDKFLWVVGFAVGLLVSVIVLAAILQAVQV